MFNNASFQHLEKVYYETALHFNDVSKESIEEDESGGSWKKTIVQPFKLLLSHLVDMSPLLFALSSVLAGVRN